MRCRGLLLVFLLFSAQSAPAAEGVEVMSLVEGAEPPAATIGDIAWLSGRWVGEGLGGAAEEVIAPAADGQMMGMFRHLKADGSINFYEFYLFAEQDGSLTLRLKHYSPMLSGWEEKDDFVEFRLVEIGERVAYFDGLTYRLGEDGRLTVGVRVGEGQHAYFHYRRAD